VQDFFENVSRYPRYLITFILGTFMAALSPLMPLLRRPSTAIVTIGFFIATFAFVAFTLRAMLGLDAA
jgi:hypothetical protein